MEVTDEPTGSQLLISVPSRLVTSTAISHGAAPLSPPVISTGEGQPPTTLASSPFLLFLDGTVDGGYGMPSTDPRHRSHVGPSFCLLVLLLVGWRVGGGRVLDNSPIFHLMQFIPELVHLKYDEDVVPLEQVITVMQSSSSSSSATPPSPPPR